MATVTSGGSYQRHCDCYSVTGICQADADTASGCQTRSRSYQQPDCDAGPGPASVPTCHGPSAGAGATAKHSILSITFSK